MIGSARLIFKTKINGSIKNIKSHKYGTAMTARLPLKKDFRRVLFTELLLIRIYDSRTTAE